jgi:hypothetical protein
MRSQGGLATTLKANHEEARTAFAQFSATVQSVLGDRTVPWTLHLPDAAGYEVAAEAPGSISSLRVLDLDHNARLCSRTRKNPIVSSTCGLLLVWHPHAPVHDNGGFKMSAKRIWMVLPVALLLLAPYLQPHAKHF